MAAFGGRRTSTAAFFFDRRLLRDDAGNRPQVPRGALCGVAAGSEYEGESGEVPATGARHRVGKGPADARHCGAMLYTRPGRGRRIRAPPCRPLEEGLRRNPARHEGILREAAHNPRLEGADLRSGPQWRMQHRQGSPAGAQAPPHAGGDGSPHGHRTARPRNGGIHRRPHLIRGNRGEDNRVAATPTDGQRVGCPSRIQERNRRLDTGRHRCNLHGRIPP